MKLKKYLVLKHTNNQNHKNDMQHTVDKRSTRLMQPSNRWCSSLLCKSILQPKREEGEIFNTTKS